MGSQKIQCPCEEEFEVNHEKEQELTTAVMGEILEGRFQSFDCPACHNPVKTEMETTFTYQGKKIAYLPELERNHYLAGKLTLPQGLHRVCFGYKELAEKVQIYGEGLSDEAVEILKYLYLQKSDSPEAVHLTYHRKQGDKLEFYVPGMKEGEVGLTAVQYGFYEKVLALLEKPTDDWKEIIQPPYVNLEKISLETGL